MYGRMIPYQRFVVVLVARKNTSSSVTHHPHGWRHVKGVTAYSRHSDRWGTRYGGRGIALALARQGVHVAVTDVYTPKKGTVGSPLSAEQDVTTTVGA